MNWIRKQIENFKTKSPIQKFWDILFLAIILMLIIPDGRIFFQRIMLKTGLFNAAVNSAEPLVVSDNDFKSFKFMDSKGEIHYLSEYKGKVLFINFWATWCPPCKAEIPSLSNLYGKLGNDSNIKFLFLSNENPDLVKQFAKKWETNLPFSTSLQIPSSLEASSLPTTHIINKKGELVSTHSGMANWDNDSFIAQIESLSKE